MNDQNTPTLEYASLAGVPKPTGMLVFGIMFCLMAVVFGCVAGVTPLALMAPQPPNATGPVLSMRMLIPAIVIYIAMATGSVILAVGCFRNRRWVPVVMLALSWPLVIVGLIYIPIGAIAAATTPLPGGVPVWTRNAGVAGVVVIGLVFMVGFPLACALYFRRTRLHEMLALRQPDAGYVARQPARMAALWLWSMLTALMFLSSLARPVVPIFGVILTGLAGGTILVFYAGAMLAIALLIFRGNRVGVWLLAAMTLLTWSSYTVSILLLGGEAMTMLAVDPSQRAAIQGNPMMNTTLQAAMTTFFGVLGLIAILWAGQAVGTVGAVGTIDDDSTAR